MKVGVHACLSNMHPNLRSSFNSENFVKVETLSCNFVKVWLKDAENSSQHHESWHVLLSSKCAFKSRLNFNSKKLVKSETPLFGFAKVGVKRGENSSLCRESWSAHISIKWASKSVIKFQYQEIVQK